MKISPLNNQNILKNIGRFCAKNNIEVYAVGGCVRDWRMGLKSKDIDLVLGRGMEKAADYIRRLHKAKIEYFAPFLTYRCFLDNGMRLDLAHFRSESYSGPAVLPKVKKAAFVGDDLKRRDFTSNSVAMGLRPDEFGEVIDLLNGSKDIEKGIIRVHHEKSFIDDPTRIFRAAKFCARFGWKPDAFTLKLINQAVKKDLPARLSRERIKNELFGILKEKKPEPVFKMLEKWGALNYIYREFRVFNNISVLREPEKRLALIACKMKTRGTAFLKSLELKREVFLKLENIIGINNLKEAPLNKIGEFEKDVLKILNPRISASALAPLMVNGFDLKKLGIPQSSRYSRIFAACARAQWKGIFKTRQAALCWLKKYIKNN